jgi:DNA-binding transcriptional ArsR family regulator
MTTAADAVFVALADPTRRQLLDVLGAGSGASASALARALPVSRQAVLKHLAVLAECELVTSERSGREVVFRVRPEPLLETASWMTSLARSWDVALADLKRRAERG